MSLSSRAAFLAAVLFTSNWYAVEFASASAAAKELQMATPATTLTVYVSDFEIDVVASESKNRTGATAPRPGTKAPDDDARKQAGRLVELMSTKLVAALQKAGYTAVRMQVGAARPDSGVGIRGLFAEVDSENHWHRALIRTAGDSGKMQAVVSVANLAKPDQALYDIANVPGNEDKPGAMITLSPYVPLTKFDLNKDAKEEVFRTVAGRIVNDLTSFLNANPHAISQ
jgi:Domain of unknown function (DUF4410)